MTITLFTILSIISFAISSLLDKRLSTIPQNGIFSAALYKLPVTALIFLPFVIVSWEQTMAAGGMVLIGALVLGVIGAFEFELYYRGLKNGQASVLFPFLLSATIALTSALAIVLLKETPALIRIAGIIGIIAGNMLLVCSAMDTRSTLFSQLRKTGLLHFSVLILLTAASNLFAASFADVIKSGLALAGWTYIFITITLIIVNSARPIPVQEHRAFGERRFL